LVEQIETTRRGGKRIQLTAASRESFSGRGHEVKNWKKNIIGETEKRKELMKVATPRPKTSFKEDNKPRQANTGFKKKKSCTHAKGGGERGTAH